uniref:RxLR effector protein n=1 Tax=Ascaris lumbricoides TaxID=6252 RepID=A0A0M3HQQ6_ASCLU
MHAIFYSLTVVGVLACLAGGSARDVAADKAVVNLLQRAVEVEGDADAHNKTIIDLLNETTTANETTVHGTLDLGHPIIAMEAFYEHSRQRIHHWMERPYAYLMVMSALIGMSSAFMIVLLFCLVNWMCKRCHARRRQRRFVPIPKQVDDGKRLIESKANDSDNDLI